MNLDFQDPFGSAKPKTVERIIDDVFCRCACLSKNGRFLAAGCYDNSVIIYDLAVFSRVSELFSEKYCPDSVIKKVSLNQNADCVAVLFENGDFQVWCCVGRCILAHIANGEEKIVWSSYHEIGLVAVQEDGSVSIVEGNSLKRFAKMPTKSQIQFVESTLDYFFAIDSNGHLFVLNSRTGDLIATFSEADLSISESSSGNSSGVGFISSYYGRNDLAIVCKNRVVRVYHFDEKSGHMVFKLKLLDAVNKWPWKHCGFSHHSELDGSMTFASAMIKGRHLVYIWENSTGSLSHTLEGPKEEISALLWHPQKPQLVTIGAITGHIYFWGPDFAQTWSALVPNVEAIETNIEYIEHENEFDLPVEDEIDNIKASNESYSIDYNDFVSGAAIGNRASDLCMAYPLD